MSCKARQRDFMKKIKAVFFYENFETVQFGNAK
jgi:hypothetical protein